MGTKWFYILVFVFVITVPSVSQGYTVESSFGDPCHEMITGTSFIDVIKQYGQQAEGKFPIPDDDLWQVLSNNISAELGVDTLSLTEMQKFILVSFIIGVRAPDTDGHSVMNLKSLEQIHGDPSDEGQYAHSLRGMDDDFDQGNATAVEGVRTMIRDYLATGKELIDTGEYKNLLKTTIYLDFYGQVELEVYGPVFYAGMAVHAVQDSFAHTIRDDASDLHKIVHVLNYIEAISSNFKEERDGLAHSDSMDQCLRPEAADLTAAAKAATVDFALVVNKFYSDSDPRALDIFLDNWITLKPGCTIEDDFCGNSRWLALVRLNQTEPYIQAMFSCHTSAGRPAPVRNMYVFLLLTFMLLLIRVR